MSGISFQWAEFPSSHESDDINSTYESPHPSPSSLPLLLPLPTLLPTPLTSSNSSLSLIPHPSHPSPSSSSTTKSNTVDIFFTGFFKSPSHTLPFSPHFPPLTLQPRSPNPPPTPPPPTPPPLAKLTSMLKGKDEGGGLLKTHHVEKRGDIRQVGRESRPSSMGGGERQGRGGTATTTTTTTGMLMMGRGRLGGGEGLLRRCRLGTGRRTLQTLGREGAALGLALGLGLTRDRRGLR